MFAEKNNKYNNLILLYLLFSYITDNSIIYFGQSKLGKFDLTLNKIKGNLKVLPNNNIYPETPSYLTIVSISINSNIYVKGPKLSTIFIGIGLVAKFLLQEAKILK